MRKKKHLRQHMDLRRSIVEHEYIVFSSIYMYKTRLTTYLHGDILTCDNARKIKLIGTPT